MVFTAVVMPNEATSLEVGTTQIWKPQTLEIGPGTALTAVEDDATGQVTHFLLLQFPPDSMTN